MCMLLVVAVQCSSSCCSCCRRAMSSCMSVYLCLCLCVRCSYAACCDFLQQNNLLSIIRAHEAQDAGYVSLCLSVCQLSVVRTMHQTDHQRPMDVALSSVWDKLRNSAMYFGKILHADPCRTCVGHGLGLMLIGVIIF